MMWLGFEDFTVGSEKDRSCNSAAEPVVFAGILDQPLTCEQLAAGAGLHAPAEDPVRELMLPILHHLGLVLAK
jgi:hypothetical protein